MKLEDIGFYTLSDQRAKGASEVSNLKRCELILTDRCNFKCTYCRGIKKEYQGDLDFKEAERIVSYWLDNELENIRFSGGEPTLYQGLNELVERCKFCGVKNIAVSTNGYSEMDVYERLIKDGVNDFSISLDACCSVIGNEISNTKGSWEKVVDNIRKLSKLTYVSVGMVFTEENIDSCVESALFADGLGVSDIRIIPSAQYNEALIMLAKLPEDILNKYPILKYRINNIRNGRHVRGIQESDCNKCWLMMDDMAVMKGFHFPCIIYLREGGEPIGKVGENCRKERVKWIMDNNTKENIICKNNCLDVCIDYNNKVESFNKELV